MSWLKPHSNRLGTVLGLLDRNAASYPTFAKVRELSSAGGSTGGRLLQSDSIAPTKYATQ